MNFVTDSINKYLTETFEKNIEDILISDLLLIEYLTIDGKDINNNKQNISFQELKVFKNLRYLEIANTLINSSTINVLANLNYLENIIFRDCTFSKQLRNMNKLTNIKSLRIINCKNFNPTYINKLTNIKRLYISGCYFNNLDNFNLLKVDSIDISDSNVASSNELEKLNTKYLVINNEQYNSFKDSILKADYKTIVMADKNIGYYIEKWIN